MPVSLAQSPLPTILTPVDSGWDHARRAWNLAVDQRPAAIAQPASETDVIAAVDFARRHGLRVAAQGTGHGAASLGSLADTLLVTTGAMRAVQVDRAVRIARVQAGALWQDVVDAAARHGLAALAGSSPNVGVVGYTLGGGQSWLGRTYGLSANNVQAIEVVTADGRLLRADSCSEPELFWALRGGGGSFGVVTAVELRLFPITEVYAGLLWWPATRAREVLQAWRQLTDADVPDEFTTAARVMRFPASPDIPELVRGRSFVIVDVIHLGAPDEADALIRPLRALQPDLDTLAMISMPALAHMHLDPEQPTPGVGDGLTLAALPADAIDRLVTVLAQPVTDRAADGGAAADRRRDGPGPPGQRRPRRRRGAVCALRRGNCRNARRSVRGHGGRDGSDVRSGAVGGSSDVPQSRGDQHRPRQLLELAGVRPAAPDQGRRRPGQPDPLQPPDPAGDLLSESPRPASTEGEQQQ